MSDLNNDDIRIVPIEEDDDDVFYPYDDESNDDNLPDIDW